jgi:hypothetical protein
MDNASAHHSFLWIVSAGNNKTSDGFRFRPVALALCSDLTAPLR